MSVALLGHVLTPIVLLNRILHECSCFIEYIERDGKK